MAELAGDLSTGDVALLPSEPIKGSETVPVRSHLTLEQARATLARQRPRPKIVDKPDCPAEFLAVDGDLRRQLERERATDQVHGTVVGYRPGLAVAVLVAEDGSTVTMSPSTPGVDFGRVALGQVWECQVNRTLARSVRARLTVRNPHLV